MVIRDLRVLKAMARRGFIKLHDLTGKSVRHWTGLYVRASFVDDVGPALKGFWQSFEYKIGRAHV